jgi:hypothetical protein
MNVTKMLKDMIQQILQEKQEKQMTTEEPPSKEVAILNFTVKLPLFSPTTVKKKLAKQKTYDTPVAACIWR